MWGAALPTHIQPLMVTQRAIIKAALGRRRRCISDAVYNGFQVRKVRQLYTKTMTLYMHEHINESFDYVQPGYQTGIAPILGTRISTLVRTSRSWVECTERLLTLFYK